MDTIEYDKPSTHELKKRFLECPICLDEFNESTKLPKVLPCLHTFCFECLHSIHKESNVTCSLCSKSYETPDGNLDVFPTDFTRRDLLDFVHAGTEPEKLRCDNCVREEPATAKYRCKDCQIYLCEACNDFHSNIRQYQGHSLFCLNSTSDNPASSIQEFARQDTCDIVGHEQKPLEYFCKSAECDKPICTSCFILIHKPHEISTIHEVYKEKKEHLQGKGRVLEERVGEVEAAIHHVEGMLASLWSKRQETNAKIQAFIDVSISHLKKREDDLLKKSESIYQHKAKTLELQLEELKKCKESLVSSKEFLEHSLSSRNEPAFLKISKFINSRFKSLLDQDINQDPYETEDLAFIPSNMGSDFAIGVNGLGAVLSERIDPRYTKISVPNDLFMGKEHVIEIQVRNSLGKPLTPENLVDISLETTCDEKKQSIACNTISDGVLEARWTPKKEGTHRFSLIYSGKREVLGSEGHVINANENSGEVYLATKEEKSTISCSDFYMDETTLHSESFLSENKKSLFNTRHSDGIQRKGQQIASWSFDWPTGSYKKYKGTRGSRLIIHPDQIYFEVCVTYNIIQDLLKTSLVFEVGIAREEIIDLHYCVGNKYGRSVIALCDTTTGKVAIECWCKNVILYRDTLSESTEGTSHTMTLGIYLNTHDRQMTVVHTDKNALMYTFADVNFSRGLRPVFGVYNPHSINVTLELKTGTAIKHLPKCLFE